MIYPLCRDPKGPATSAVPTPQKMREGGTHLSTRGLISISNQGAVKQDTLNPQAKPTGSSGTPRILKHNTKALGPNSHWGLGASLFSCHSFLTWQS